MPAAAPFPFDNTYARDLQGFYVPWQPTAVPAPRLLFLNHALAEELGLDGASLDGPEGTLTGDTPTKPMGGAEEISWAADSKSVFFVGGATRRAEQPDCASAYSSSEVR